VIAALRADGLATCDLSGERAPRWRSPWGRVGVTRQRVCRAPARAEYEQVRRSTRAGRCATSADGANDGPALSSPRRSQLAPRHERSALETAAVSSCAKLSALPFLSASEEPPDINTNLDVFGLLFNAGCWPVVAGSDAILGPAHNVVPFRRAQFPGAAVRAPARGYS